MQNTTPRYQIRPQRVMGWYVLDTHTGAVWTGFARPGAQSLADRFNRAATYDAGDRIRDNQTNAVGTVTNSSRDRVTVAWDNGRPSRLPLDRAELVCRAADRQPTIAPVWGDQQLTFGDAPADAQQGALFAL